MRAAAESAGRRPVQDARLAAHLEILLLGLRAYLRALREAWSRPGSAAPPEVEGVLAAVGAQPEPTADERRRAGGLLKRATAEAGGGLARIVGALDLELGDECLLAGAWWAEADPQLAVALGCGHDDAARRHASAPLLRLVLAPFGIAVPPAVDRAGALVRLGVIEDVPGAGEALRLTATARLVLSGTPLPPLRAPAPHARHARARAALAAHLASGAGGVVVLCGPAGVGARALAAGAAEDAGLLPLAGGRPAPELRLAARLRAGLPVLAAEEAAALDWRPDDGPLVVLARDRASAPPGYAIDVPPPTRAERVEAWREGLAGAGVTHDAGFAEALAARFAFTDGDIDETIERARRDALWPGGVLDADAVWSAARRQPEHALDRLAALVRPAFSLDDLVLPDEAHAKLRELAAHVALQHVVLDRWGFRRRLPRGQGVIALFSGPPGTGKTMAAEALAESLRQDLYRIDLSAVVSKWVGETEKNLAAAFDEAERAGAVLLFDEADALFGRRTEVRDAHDRYANLEVNYLLQRVETFTGLVILATNRPSALDDAFLRRLRFVIRFEAPDRGSRRALWRRAFPPETRLEEFDWEALAGPELTGANIQSVALAAAYLAAANGGAVGAEHLEHALRREHEKIGRAWPEIRLGGVR